MNPTVQSARDFALEAHGDQRYGTHPYSYHLDAVAELVAPFGEHAQIAAYLHDTVEDTGVNLRDIATRFGSAMADCVAILTDDEGANRRERKVKTNAKLAATTNALALIVKTADRLANLLESTHDPSSGKLAMYRREHEAFRSAVFRAGLCDELWDRIDAIIQAEST